MARMRRIWDWFGGLDPLLVDGLLGVVLGVGSGVELLHDVPGQALKLPLIALPPLALTLRRRYPLVVWLVQGAASGLAQRPPTLIGFVALVIGFYSVGAHSRHRLRSLAFLAGGALLLQLSVRQARPPLPDWSRPEGGFAVRARLPI